MMDLRSTLLATVAVAALSFGGGYYTHSRFTKADQLDAVATTQHQTASNVQQSLTTSVAVEASAAASIQQVGEIRKVVAARLKPKETPHAQTASVPSNTDAHGDCVWTLDTGTVVLLNAARTGAASGAASVSDDQSQTPSGIDLAAFIDNDLEVVGLYRELATRHDALVDYVTSLVKQQAE